MNEMEKTLCERNKEEFIGYYTKYIKREGSQKLLDFLSRSDFFTAPASTKFHGAYEGGLCRHSINVFLRLKADIEAERAHSDWAKEVSDETIAICGLLHDMCKVNYYKVEMRNVKVGNSWQQQPYFITDDTIPYGHGEKSVYIISGFFRLTREEAMAINWHMGGFDDRARGGSFAISVAYNKFPLAVMMNLADMQATYFDENTEI